MLFLKEKNAGGYNPPASTGTLREHCSITRTFQAWCLKENDMGILWTERSMARAMCGVQLKNRKCTKDLMLMLGLNETIDQLATANGVR